jgi:hypothetical protein
MTSNVGVPTFCASGIRLRLYVQKYHTQIYWSFDLATVRIVYYSQLEVLDRVKGHRVKGVRLCVKGHRVKGVRLCVKGTESKV